MPVKKRILFIINPVSGTKDKNLLPQLVSQVLDEAFLTETVYTRYRGHATELAATAAHLGYDAVVACGGDGTVHEVGVALIRSETALGIVPVGSGNGLARHHSIPMGIREALEVIRNFHVTPMDTGTVNNIPFLGVAGLGFDALIGKKFARLPRRGFITYLKIVLREYFSYREKKVRIRFKGKKLVRRVLMLTIANSSQFGNNAVIAPGARTDDGQLQLCLVRKFSLWQAPWFAWLLFRGKSNQSRYIESYQVRKVEILHKIKRIHLDGEPVSAGRKLQVAVRPGSLSIIVPEKKQSKK